MHAYSLLVGSLAWLCPVPDECSLSYSLIKSFLTAFWVRGSIHYACVHSGLSAATGVGLPATRETGASGLKCQPGVGHGDTCVRDAPPGAGAGIHSRVCVCTGNTCSALLLVGPGAWSCGSLTAPGLLDLA